MSFDGLYIKHPILHKCGSINPNCFFFLPFFLKKTSIKTYNIGIEKLQIQ